VAAAIMFLFLLGFQDNNWEIPQAWFAAMQGIKVLYAGLINGGIDTSLVGKP
jgi:hypothetical protein